MFRSPHWARPVAAFLIIGLLMLSGRASANIRQAAVDGATKVQGKWQAADFMEDTNEEIARENRRNPLQAWALAFFPTALVKGITLGLAFAMAEEEKWAGFLPIIPSMGISHYWETGVYWAGAIATVGDLVGGALLTYYFTELYDSTAANRPSKTMLYAGISILAVFFVYENVSAPIFANWVNKRLRRQFMPAKESARLGPSWRQSPWPTNGLAHIGPGIRQPTPVGASWAFKF